ncbi:MAG: hypothetical protein L0216_02540 [Planctomycetales bacterium]|nr:hypothetical protein [Planctomycetales bacterium]
MRRKDWIAGGLGALLICAVAAATAYGIDPWHGRLTKSLAGFEALRFTLSDPTVLTSCRNRYNQDNDLVDMAGQIHQAVAGGWEVHVNLNFEPVGGAPRLGDIEALVFVNSSNVAEYFISLWDPLPEDDLTIPPSLQQVNDSQENEALKCALNDATVRSCATTRFSAGVWMWDENVVLVTDNGISKTYDATLTFKKSNGGTPAPGKRNIIARVTVLNDLSVCVIESVT